jgi:hypothetical protein
MPFTRIVTLPVGRERRLALRTSASGTRPRQSTTVALRWTGERLEVRFAAVDDDPWSTFTERDAPLWQEEVVEVFLAPGAADPRRYVELEVSPRGVLFDAVVDNPDGVRATMRVDTGWDCPGLVWRATPSSRGYQVDLEIPLAAVAEACQAPSGDVWRANFYRIDRPRYGREAEFSAWSPTLADPPDFHRPERFGCLRLEPKEGTVTEFRSRIR